MAAELSKTNRTNTFANKQTPSRQVEIVALLALLIIVNLRLLFSNASATELVFHPQSILSGDWWRIFSWPFAHVSRYHLLIDGTAFILLYHGLQTESRNSRIALTSAVICGSLVLPLLISPEMSQLGLCGLSGPAHGLMAISALELMHHGEKKLGGLLLTGLFLKTGWELFTGTAFLHQIHLGDIGQPIVSTHAGGVAAGTLCYYIHLFSAKTPLPEAEEGDKPAT